MIDPAMVRPGRLDKLLYVDLPTAEERAEIVRTMTRKLPLGRIASGSSTAGTLDPSGDKEAVRAAVEAIVKERCDGYSGADLASLVREAGVVALKRTLGTIRSSLANEWGAAADTTTPSIVVDIADFVVALDKIPPSVSVSQRKKYQALRSKFSGLPVRVGKDEEEKRVDEKTAS